MSVSPAPTLDAQLMRAAALDALRKLAPNRLIHNPVIFVTAVVSALASLLLLGQLFDGHRDSLGFSLQLVIWLWFTVLFANFSEALAEGRGKAQARALRSTRSDTPAQRLGLDGRSESVSASELRLGDRVRVEAGALIPADGEVIRGVAAVDESAITGESAPVIREAGGDRSAVTGGTRVLSDTLDIRVTAISGSSFLDRMIALVEGAQRHKTPNEIALNVLLAGLSLVFVMGVATLPGIAAYSGVRLDVIVLIALLVTLIPTTIGALLSAIGIAGMNRLVACNVLARSGRAVEAAGDIDTLLLDKTGTITLGNRQAVAFLPLSGTRELELAEAALLSSLADETPEGRSILALARERHGLGACTLDANARFVEFSARTRMSGVDVNGQLIRKGAVDAILSHLAQNGQLMLPAAADELQRHAAEVSHSGGTPLAVARNGRVLGIIQLKDIVKSGIRERLKSLRAMGIRTVMITGDNPMTAASIAADAGVDDFLAQATPERKLEYIRSEQALGKRVAMCGDGTNDAPALAQADVGVAMQTGTVAAREAGNMVDLDSDPTKLIEIVGVGKQLLMTRGALTTFSIANDVAKYFAIIPAMFMSSHPQLSALNLMQLESPQSAILSAIVFNALIILALVPLALRGVSYRPGSAAALLRRNLLSYGLGGLLVPFIGIKLVDLLVNAVGLV